MTLRRLEAGDLVEGHAHRTPVAAEDPGTLKAPDRLPGSRQRGIGGRDDHVDLAASDDVPDTGDESVGLVRRIGDLDRAVREARPLGSRRGRDEHRPAGAAQRPRHGKAGTGVAVEHDGDP